jgi:hypothetical protein
VRRSVLGGVKARILTEIQRAVEGKLVRSGAAGSVLVDDGKISLVGNGEPVSLPLDGLDERWTELAFEERERESAHLARSLQRQRRPLSPVAPRGRSRTFGLLVGAGLVLAAAVTYRKVQARLQLSAALEAARQLEQEINEPDRERERHAAQVCNATRARLARGGTVGPADVEGWVVELALVRQMGSDWPTLAPFLALPEGATSGRVSWDGAPELTGLTGHDTRVEVHDELWPETMPQYRERRLTFFGSYVAPYFREREQIQLIRLGHALAEQHQATLGALYARCADRDEHHMGSWFLGTSPGAAAASLLFFMGAYAAPPQLPGEVLSSRKERPFEPEFALTNLLVAAQRLKKPELISRLGPQDGTVAGSGNSITLAFPFVQSDRALLASYALTGLLEPAAGLRR